MNLLLAAVAVLILALAGVGGLRLVWGSIGKASRPVRLALGFCAGTFLVSVVFFIAYLVGLSFSRLLVLGPIAALAIAGIFGMLPRGVEAGSSREKPWLAGLLAVVALVLSWGRPIHGYDAVMMWGLKAKMMFFAKTWPATMFDPFTTAHTEYPPLVPSAQAFVFYWLGEFDDVASRIVFAAWFAAGAIILWWLLGRLRTSSRTMWLLWWCAMPVAMEQVNLTYADLPLAVYLLVFYGSVAAWLREPAKNDWCWLAGVFGGMAFWVKQDAVIGVGAGLATLVALAAVKKLNWRPILVMIAAVAVLAVPWRTFVWVRNLPSDFALNPSAITGKTGAIAEAIFHYLIVEGGFAFFWPVIAFTLLFRWRRIREMETAWLFGSLLMSFLAVFAVYWSSKDNLSALLQTSIERVLLGLIVPALLLGATLWRGRFIVLRCQFKVFVAGVVVAVAMFCVGWQKMGDHELFRSTVAFPWALSWVWLIAGLLTIWKAWPLVRLHGTRSIWRSVQFGVATATMGLALAAVAIHSEAAGEVWHQYAGKTLLEQHLLTIPDPLRRQIGQALNTYPIGTHVGVLPKRSRWRHQFYYETYPVLIVDSLSSNVIQLTGY